MYVKSPGSVKWEADDVERINRVQVALLLHMKPEEVDTMPVRDVQDVLAIQQANDQIAAWRMKRK